MKRFLYLIVLIGFAQAQELDCKVRVQRPSIQGVDPTIFTNMEKEIYEFMNLRKWTNDDFKPEERIKCSINIIITGGQAGGTTFDGTMQIQVIRPVLNSSYESLILNFNDKDFKVDYVPFQTVQFSDNSYVNNISSLLMFWGYTILGVDYDTFGKEAGTPFFEQARNIMNLAQNSGNPGWQAIDGNRSRYWLIENLLNSSYRAYRSAIYTYHRMGLDKMHEDVNKGRVQIMNSLAQLEQLFNQNPNLYIIRVFTDAKTNELIPMFKQAQPAEKQRFIRMMTRMDPNNATQYNSVRETK